MKKNLASISPAVRALIIAFIWSLLGIVWGALLGGTGQYPSSFVLPFIFYFPAFLLNGLVSLLIQTSLTDQILGLGRQGNTIFVFENASIIFVISYALTHLLRKKS